MLLPVPFFISPRINLRPPTMHKFNIGENLIQYLGLNDSGGKSV